MPPDGAARRRRRGRLPEQRSHTMGQPRRAPADGQRFQTRLPSRRGRPVALVGTNGKECDACHHQPTSADSPAPATPATIAKVVTGPSIAPQTMLRRYTRAWARRRGVRPRPGNGRVLETDRASLAIHRRAVSYSLRRGWGQAIAASQRPRAASAPSGSARRAPPTQAQGKAAKTPASDPSVPRCRD